MKHKESQFLSEFTVISFLGFFYAEHIGINFPSQTIPYTFEVTFAPPRQYAPDTFSNLSVTLSTMNVDLTNLEIQSRHGSYSYKYALRRHPNLQ